MVQQQLERQLVYRYLWAGRKAGPFFIFILLSSCGIEPSKSKLQFEEAPENDDVVTYQEVKTVILVPQCIRCHTKYLIEEGVREDIIPGDAEESHLFQHVRDGTMPVNSPPLSSQEVELIRNYIDQLPEGSPGNDDDDHDHEG